ncbi:MAG: hypothetical protein ACTSRK_14110 [Promethearchaeota archaeon]
MEFIDWKKNRVDLVAALMGSVVVLIPLKAMKLPGMRGGIEVRYQNNSLDKFLSSKLKKKETSILAVLKLI